MKIQVFWDLLTGKRLPPFQRSVVLPFAGLGPGYTRDCLPAYSFVLRARAMVLTGQCTLSDKSQARR